MTGWPEGPLRERGLALASKLIMLQRIALRINQQIQRLKEGLNDESKLNNCIQQGYAYPLPDRFLPYEILVDIESLIFESRSVYEIIGHFLKNFFRHILEQHITEAEVIGTLKERGIDTQWIRVLRDFRVLFFHDTAPWPAVKIVSREPLKIELVILKKTVQRFDNPDDYIEFDEIRSIYEGLDTSLGVIYQWIIEKIEEFEEEPQA